jgi:hypothetical protein
VLYGIVQALTPHDDAQRKLKDQATTLAIDLGQLRSLLLAQSVPSHFEADADHSCLLARNHFHRLQRARAA